MNRGIARTLVLALLTACGTDVPPSGDAPEAWHIEEAPRLVLGTGATDAHVLYRVVGVVRLRNGHLVVANGGSGELRFFTPDGTHLRSVGREGAGPGEFRALAGLWHGPDDSLFAWDRELARMSVFDATGRFARVMTFAAPADLGSPRPEGLFPDGSWLVSGRSGWFAQATAGAVTSTPVRLGRFDAGGSFAGHVATVAGPSWYGFGEGPQLQFWTVPFTAGGAWALADGLVAVGDGDRPLYRVLDAAGAAVREVALPSERRDVTAPLRERYRRMLEGAAASPAEGRQIAQFLGEVPMPEEHPAYDRIRAGADGSWWLRRFPLPDASHTDWLVFDRDGTVRARVRLPAGFRVFGVGADAVLGVDGGDLEAERVVAYRIERGSTTP